MKLRGFSCIKERSSCLRHVCGNEERLENYKGLLRIRDTEARNKKSQVIYLSISISMHKGLSVEKKEGGWR
jgi:hypothetical protein